MVSAAIVEDLLFKENPELGMFERKTDHSGSIGRPIILPYATTAGVSPVFADAQATKRDAEEAKMLITTNDMFALFSLDHKSVAQTKSDKGAYYDLVSSRTKSCMSAYKRTLAHAWWGNGGGSLGTIASNSGTTITLNSDAAMWMFQKNMTIVPCTGDGTSGTLGATEDVIGAINQTARTLTADDGAFSGGAGEFAAGNHIMLRGAYGAYIRGASAWWPTSAPSASPFFGLVRTDDTRFYGTIYAPSASDTNALEYLQSLSRAIAETDDEAEPDVVLCSYAFMNVLVKQMGALATWNTNLKGVKGDGDTASWGFRGVTIVGATGPIQVVQSRMAPRNKIAMLTRKHCFWDSIGDYMQWLTYEDDNTKFRAHGSENAMEARLGGYLQFVCSRPSTCATADISSYL